MISTADFSKLKEQERKFIKTPRRLAGTVPTIAITPVADGRTGAFESNVKATWALVERVHKLISDEVRLYDGTVPYIVIPPEIVYGARSGAIAQEYYTRMGVSINIWVSRSWSYSDELLSAAQGLGSSEWIQAAYGLNQTDRPGAVWLKAFCAAMDEKLRPIFSIYNPDLEEEKGPLAPYVRDRLLTFARAACAVKEMRGKNYLSIGSVSMGIIGSDVRRNVFGDYFGMGTVSVDMAEVRGRMDEGFYDKAELKKAMSFFNNNFKIVYNKGKKPLTDEKLLEESCKMALIVRDLMVGNPKLAAIDIEKAQGHHAIAAGTQGQRAWTDHYPNFDLTESILNSSFDWNGFRPGHIIATENDSKNAMGMLAAQLITGLPQLFADIRTNWTPASVKNRTGMNISKTAPQGFIDKRNSGAAALDYAVDIFKLTGVKNGDVFAAARKLSSSKTLQEKLIKNACKGTTYFAAILEYFLGDGLSSHYSSPGGIPMTAYRYNVMGDDISCSIVEGETIDLPANVVKNISSTTNETWPETYWRPDNMSSFEYMSRIGPNHDSNSFGRIGKEMIALNAMLRIPVDLTNLPREDVFRPTLWDRYGNDDQRVCEKLGPLYR